MQSWIIEVMGEFGYAGVFLLIALENIFPPIPSEVILAFGGAMTTFTPLTVLGVVLSATAGSLAGAVILYKVGTLLDVHTVEKAVSRWGHLLRLSKKDVEYAQRWFDRYGYWTVLICRVIPFIRSLISIPAGMARMKMPLFLLFTAVGTLIWNFLIVFTGAVFGESWSDILRFLHMYAMLVYIGIGAGFLAFIIIIFKKRQQ
ncbi:DedA family protein [Bacillus thermotolerans]|uniref:Alkaline phosphatase n=1 Tax=Bacillus thermotolerans TaxID=1221996 RepID=A0A0F5I8B5_BACTR|nr:DedA family protein [Bacillus thermotolerans]KKB34062.1 Alkaline phosphatase [Bacillus thermotolerans]KKB34778.1 Alkaline phosphatase [Bacillus thermotolerans]KKB41515.1 Alkaline phosphatase [Bacillus thermotolerans]